MRGPGLRIIAGALKGRRIDTPGWAGLRPTGSGGGAASPLLGAVVVAVTGTLLELVIRPSAPSTSR